ncbi:MAG: dockerin type I domain-containing protein [Pirellulaceae bacterium]
MAKLLPAYFPAPDCHEKWNKMKLRRNLFTESLESRRVLTSSLGVDGTGIESAELSGAVFQDVARSAHNEQMPADVNGDEAITAIDVLLVVNALNAGETVDTVGHKCDTNGDGVLSAVDALITINTVNEPEGEPSGDLLSSSNQSPSDDERAQSEGEDDSALGDELDEDNSDHERDLDHLWEDGFAFARIGLGSGGFLDRAVEQVFEAFDENDDDVLQEEEAPRFAWEYLISREIDADGNSEITLQEIDSSLEAYRSDRFNELDDSGDGLLTSDELPEPIWNRIQNADSDGDDAVSFDELEAFRDLTRFERRDTNGDGNLTQDEVPERLWNRISRFDANEDGRVSRDELPDRESRFEERISRIANFAAGLFRQFRDR